MRLFGSLLGVDAGLLTHSSKDNDVWWSVSMTQKSPIQGVTYWCPFRPR